MSDEPTTPIRWIEGHIAELDAREAGCSHAIRAALSPADEQPHRTELAEVRRVRAEWQQVQRLIQTRPRKRTR